MPVTKSVSQQLKQLDREARADKAKRKKAYPLRVAQKASIPDIRTKKLRARSEQLTELYELWCIAGRRRFEHVELKESAEPWRRYDLPTRDGIVYDSTLLDSVLTYDHGIPSDIRGIHAAHEHWFGIPQRGIPYDIDCAVLLAQFIMHFWWSKDNDSVYLLYESPWVFPVLDPALGEGPFMPATDAKFGEVDRHLIVADEGELFMFNFEEELWNIQIL